LRSEIVQLANRLLAVAAAGLLSVACTAQQAAPAPATAQEVKDGKSLPPKTLEEARTALHTAEATHPGNTPEVVLALVALAGFETEAAHVGDESLEIADRAVRMAEAAPGKDSTLYATALAAKARVLLAMDRPEMARPPAEEALAIEQRVISDPEGLASAAGILSNVCEGEGDEPCALKNAEIQVNVLRSLKDLDVAELAWALMNLADSRRLNNDTAGEKAALAEVMAIAEHAEKADSQWEMVENNAGGMYITLGDYAGAVEHLKKGLDLSTKLNGPDSLSQSSELANLAYVEMCLGQGSEALKYYARARELYAKRYGPGHSETANLESGYGYALSMLGNHKLAVEQALAAHRVMRERIRLAIRLLPERQALALADSGGPSFNLAVSVVARHPEIETADVYQEVVRSRSLVAEEMAQRQAALNRKRDPAVEALERELESDRKAVMELQGTSTADNTAAALSDASAKMERTERELAERSAAFRTDERVRSSDLALLRKNMPAGSVLISYVQYARYTEEIANFNKPPDWWYMALVLHLDSQRIGVYDLGQSKQIAALVKRMRNSADAEAHGGGLGSVRNEREYREAAVELRKRIWDPLQGDLGPAKLVFVVPDGVLSQVPFSALPDGTGYLVEHGPVVHILTMERDLLPGETVEKKTGLLAVGSPSFELAGVEAPPGSLRDAPTDCESFDKIQFNPLPGSLNEVNDISSSWRRWNGDERAQLLTGDDATRSRFLEAAPQSRILHVATHAFVLDKSCGNGNPLLLSGLVFAGANKSRHASILTAQEIASLDLRGVDWAVLSACNTGYGQAVTSEGVMGLERAFRVAGAKSVVMALWPVDDQMTREFMRGLYSERFGRHATTANAVWNAQRRLLKERQLAGKSTHPWYWAGFVGAGGWE
jgi:CHAT domain-containing protein/tetratricopeptide (TPR) repeat protein